MKDFYAILGVEKTADDTALKSAYRKLAKEYHPDTNKSPGAEARFKEVSEAYETLKDPQKRAQHDMMMRSGRPGPGPSPTGGSGGAYSWANNPHFRGGQRGPDIDIEEILRDLKRSRGSSPFAEDAKNRDIVLSYSITLEEAFTGKDADISYNLPGKNQQKMQFKIPPGIQDGIKLRFQGKGDDQMKHVAPGDLYVKVTIVPHHSFIRMGNNLLTSISIDYFDALLGTEKEVPTIDGKRIKMKVPAGILPGQSLRAGGKGMPINPDKRGDMMVEVTFESVKLTLDQKDLIEQARSKKSP